MSDHDHIYMPEDHMDRLYNSKNIFVRFVHNKRLDEIIKAVPEYDERIRILDAGCGEGHLIQRLYEKFGEKYEYHGVDITDGALNKAKNRCPYAKINKKDLLTLDYENEYFHVIICTEVLEHIHEYMKAVSELKRVLKNNGLLIITFPNETLWTLSRIMLLRRPFKVPDHVNSFNPRKIRSEVDMELVSETHLPFKLPFTLSLGCVMKFRK